MIVIMGPGRCGTTLIIRILEEMGYDTGSHHEIFREINHSKLKQAKFKWPRVIKGTGTLCAGLNTWIKECGWDVEVIIFCKREIKSNIASMIKIKRNKGIYKKLTEKEHIKRIQKEVPNSYVQAEKGIKNSGCKNVEIYFPKSATNINYCYSRLKKAIPNLNKEKFEQAWNKIVDPKLIRFGG